jgi:hypothetical protein
MSDPSDPLNTGNRMPETGEADLEGFPVPAPFDPAAPGEVSTAQPAAEPIDPSASSQEFAGFALAGWKDELRRDFENWLESLDQIPEAEGTFAADDAGDAPDLFSFFEQFAAANSEWRRANRRTAEAMSQWGETLARFESGLQPLRETAVQLLAAQPKGREVPRAQCLMLVELLDRFQRLARVFATPPVAARPWWGRGTDAAWRQAWETQRRAIDILVSHLDSLLRKEGVARIETSGQPFDPAVMLAVAAEPDATRPPQIVLEEVVAGYRRHDELLRPAQVIVSRQP